MSIVNKLYKSRKYYGYESDVVELVRLIESVCQNKGYTLSRWETGSKSNSFCRTVIYAVHRGMRRKRFCNMMADDVLMHVELRNIEGTSKRCEAAYELEKLLTFITENEREDV